MKKVLIVAAIVLAVAASTGLGNIHTASAFNPQPEPPGAMPADWWDTEIVSMMNVIAEAGPTSGRTGDAKGIIIIDNLPDPNNAPGLTGVGPR